MDKYLLNIYSSDNYGILVGMTNIKTWEHFPLRLRSIRLFLSSKLGLWPSFCRKLKCDVFSSFFFPLFHLSWSKRGRCFVIVTTGHVTIVVVQTGLFVHRWMLVLNKSTNCTDVTAKYKLKKIVLYSISVQHSTDCTPYTNIRAVHNWQLYACLAVHKLIKVK